MANNTTAVRRVDIAKLAANNPGVDAARVLELTRLCDQLAGLAPAKSVDYRLEHPLSARRTFHVRAVRPV